MFVFSPLQGAFSDSPASQSLLELDGGVKVLIGLGWDESFDPARLQELEKLVQNQSISLILLTHATVGHLAAYAHCCKNFLRFTEIPVYATRPVIDLGRSLIHDIYDSTPLAAGTIDEASLAEASFAYTQKPPSIHNLLRQIPTSEEIAKFFSLIQPLKYSQPHQPLPTPGTPPLNGLTITAYNSGRTLGGTIWHIQHGLESIVYAVDWNQARENVFAGAAWLGGTGAGGADVIEQLRKPTALICSTRGVERPIQPGGRLKRDEQLIDMVKFCVSRGGTVLIPVDSSARVLEIAYIMEHAWREDARKNNGDLTAAKLYLVGRSMSSTVRYARTMLEWMDDNINREFEAVPDTQRKPNGTGDDRPAKDAGPFDFKHLRILERKAQVRRLLGQNSDNVHAEARVILASDSTLEWGFSKDLLKGLSKDSRNVVLLTEKPGIVREDRPSIAAALWSLWKDRNDGFSSEQGASGEKFELVYGGGKELEIDEVSRQALDDEESALYQQWLAQRQIQQTVQSGGATSLEAAADVDDDASSESSDSDDSDTEQQGKALNVSTTMGQASRKHVLRDEDLGVNVVLKRKSVHDFGRLDTRKGRDRMFPVVIRRKRNDDYGELIRPEDYLRAEERQDVDGGLDGNQASTAEEDAKLGTKRKWDDASNAAKNGPGPGKRPTMNRTVSDDGDGRGSGVRDGDELDEVEDDEPETTGPSRLVRTVGKVTLNLRIGFVDFSGLHDRRSLNMLLPLIQPRKLILVAGSRDETLAVAEDYKKLLESQSGEEATDETSNVYTPEVGTRVDASVDTNAWTLMLADTLVKTIKWQSVKDISIVTITGQLLGIAKDNDIRRPVEEGANKRPKIDSSSNNHDTTDQEMPDSDEKADTVTITPTLDVLSNMAAATARAWTQPLHVGDLRLTDLRRSLQSAGHGAEFRGEGTLLIDGIVAVRKTAAGRIEVESVLAANALPVAGRRSTFYEVRKAIYDSLAVVAGA